MRDISWIQARAFWASSYRSHVRLAPSALRTLVDPPRRHNVYNAARRTKFFIWFFYVFHCWSLIIVFVVLHVYTFSRWKNTSNYVKVITGSYELLHWHPWLLRDRPSHQLIVCLRSVDSRARVLIQLLGLLAHMELRSSVLWTDYTCLSWPDAVEWISIFEAYILHVY